MGVENELKEVDERIGGVEKMAGEILDDLRSANKRISIFLGMAIVFIVLSNGAWLYAWIAGEETVTETTTTSTEIEDVEITTDGSNDINYSIGIGDIINGIESEDWESESNEDNDKDD